MELEGHGERSVFEGEQENDLFGAALSIDRSGEFLVIGTGGGGYVRAMSWQEDIPLRYQPGNGKWKIVGDPIVDNDENICQRFNNNFIDGNATAPTTFGSADATGRINGSCQICPFLELD